MSDLGPVERRGLDFNFNLDADTTPQELLRTLVERNISVETFEIASVPLEEIFITVVKEDHNE